MSAAGSIVYRKFTTRAFSSGVPTTLSGVPVVSVYKDGSTTETTTGVTLTVDFDSRTGLNHVAINTAADGTFYANGSRFELVITTGTVAGTSVVGESVGAFDLAASVWDEVNTGATHNVTNSTGKQLRTLAVNTDVIYSSTLPSQSGVTSTQVKLDTGASSVDNAYQWDVFSAISGTGQGSRVCISYVGSTRLATFATAWTVAPVAGDVVEVTPTAQVQVASYIAGQDPATLVLDVAAASHNTGSTVGAKINLIGSDTSGVTTLLSRITTAPPTAAAIATAVLTDTGDNTTAGSPGKILAQLGSAFTTTSSSVFTSAALANGPVGSGGLDAAGVRAAIGMASANLDTQLAAIKSEEDTISSTLTTVAGNVTTLLAEGDPWATDLAYGSYTGTQAGAVLLNLGIDESTLIVDIDTRLSLMHGAGPWGGTGLDAAGIRAAIGMASANLDAQIAAIESGISTIEGGVTTIINQTSSGTTAAEIRAAIGMASANMDGQLTGILAAVNSRLATSAYVAPLDAAGIRAAVGLAAANLDTQLDAIPTAAENADKLLGRSVTGGSDGDRTVREAFYFLRNRWNIVGGVLTVYARDDQTTAWTATVAQSSATPVTGVDPA